MPDVTAESHDLSPQEVAHIVGVHVDSIKRWTEQGLLPCLRTPGGWRRYRRSDVDDFIAAHSAWVKPA